MIMGLARIAIFVGSYSYLYQSHMCIYSLTIPPLRKRKIHQTITRSEHTSQSKRHLIQSIYQNSAMFFSKLLAIATVSLGSASAFKYERLDRNDSVS